VGTQEIQNTKVFKRIGNYFHQSMPFIVIYIRHFTRQATYKTGQNTLSHFNLNGQSPHQKNLHYFVSQLHIAHIHYIITHLIHHLY